MVRNIEVELDTQESTFEVEMGVFTDDSFTSPVGSNFTIDVPNKIFIGLSLGGESGMVLQGKNCWATPRFVIIKSMFGE